MSAGPVIVAGNTPPVKPGPVPSSIKPKIPDYIFPSASEVLSQPSSQRLLRSATKKQIAHKKAATHEQIKDLGQQVEQGKPEIEDGEIEEYLAFGETDEELGCSSCGSGDEEEEQEEVVEAEMKEETTAEEKQTAIVKHNFFLNTLSRDPNGLPPLEEISGIFFFTKEAQNYLKPVKLQCERSCIEVLEPDIFKEDDKPITKDRFLLVHDLQELALRVQSFQAVVAARPDGQHLLLLKRNSIQHLLMITQYIFAKMMIVLNDPPQKLKAAIQVGTIMLNLKPAATMILPALSGFIQEETNHVWDSVARNPPVRFHLLFFLYALTKLNEEERKHVIEFTDNLPFRALLESVVDLPYTVLGDLCKGHHCRSVDLLQAADLILRLCLQVAIHPSDPLLQQL
jgi:hypothetical protein